MRTGIPVDPDQDEARRWLEDELRDPDYQLRESFLLRAWRWVQDHLPSLDLSGQLPPWTTWAVLGAVLLVALAVVAFAARDGWRRGRLAQGPPGAVLGPTRLSATAYRERALAASSAGDHDATVLEAYRAIAAGAHERALVDERPGRTAHEVATALAPAFPDEAGALAAAADAFDAVRYGGARATAERAGSVLELERRLAAARPVHLTGAGLSGAGPR